MMNGKRVKQVSCGALHCAVLLDDSRVLTWGVGDGGRLGHGDTLTRGTPTILQKLAGEAVAKVVCSAWHSAALVVVPPYTKGREL
jgi:alpha-tubulin suppressor-like RCC1 family protein